MTSPVQSFYSQKSKLYQRLFVDFLQWGKALEAFFREHAYLHSGMKVLDAGCGSGVVTRVLYELARQRGFDQLTFHAFDLTPEMLDLFRQWIQKQGAQDIQLQQADVLALPEQLPADWSAYDLIVSSTMLEYIPKEKIGLALGNLRSLLRQPGRLLLLVTRRTRLTEWAAGRWWRTNLFDEHELADALRQAGFDAIKNQTLPGRWDAFILAIEAGN
jgi:cyclopropane fatty-acyl-phospholipid synthase-like methyltransferase